MNALKDGGVTQKWGAALQEPFQRRNVFMGELKRVGVLKPEAIGIASISEAHSHAALNYVLLSQLAQCQQSTENIQQEESVDLEIDGAHVTHKCRIDCLLLVQGMTKRS